MMFREMRKLYKRGYKIIAGLDEAGRGPLAGPVVACVVAVKFSIWGGRTSRGRSDLQLLEGIKDSKKLSAKHRDVWYKILTRHPDIRWGIGIVSEKNIDKINILEATKLAMRKAVAKLKVQPDFLIVDGNFSIRMAQSSPCGEHYPKAHIRIIPYSAIPKADEKIFLCMAAGIIAKVHRDRMMKRLHKKYPQYGFDKHKGYGTKEHLRGLRKYGACKIHRRSFGPVKKLGKNPS